MVFCMVRGWSTGITIIFLQICTMNIEKIVQLKPGKEVPLKRYHPWVFSGAILKQSANITDGDWVEVEMLKITF